MPVIKAFQLFETENNNHGCSGISAVILPWPGHSLRQGKVVHISGGCSTCGADTFLEKGDLVQLPLEFVGSWAEAAEEDPYFYRTDISLAGRTRVRPSELLLKEKKRARKEPEEEEGVEELLQLCKEQEGI